MSLRRLFGIEVSRSFDVTEEGTEGTLTTRNPDDHHWLQRVEHERRSEKQNSLKSQKEKTFKGKMATFSLSTDDNIYAEVGADNPGFEATADDNLYSNIGDVGVGLSDGSGKLSGGELLGGSVELSGGGLPDGSVGLSGGELSGGLSDGSVELSGGGLSDGSVGLSGGELSGVLSDGGVGLSGGGLSDGSVGLSGGELSGVLSDGGVGLSGGGLSDGSVGLSGGELSGGSAGLSGGELSDGSVGLSGGGLLDGDVGLSGVELSDGSVGLSSGGLLDGGVELSGDGSSSISATLPGTSLELEPTGSVGGKKASVEVGGFDENHNFYESLSVDGPGSLDPAVKAVGSLDPGAKIEGEAITDGNDFPNENFWAGCRSMNLQDWAESVKMQPPDKIKPVVVNATLPEKYQLHTSEEYVDIVDPVIEGGKISNEPPVGSFSYIKSVKSDPRVPSDGESAISFDLRMKKSKGKEMLSEDFWAGCQTLNFNDWITSEKDKPSDKIKRDMVVTDKYIEIIDPVVENGTLAAHPPPGTFSYISSVKSEPVMSKADYDDTKVEGCLWRDHNVNWYWLAFAVFLVCLVIILAIVVGVQGASLAAKNDR